MASRTFVRALRSPASRQFVAPVQKRTIVTAFSAARAAVAVAPRFAGVPLQQKRGVKTIDFAGVKEEVYGWLFMMIMIYDWVGL